MKNLVLTLIFSVMLVFSMSALAGTIQAKTEKGMGTSPKQEHRLSTHEHGKKVEEVKGHVKRVKEEHFKGKGHVDKEKVKEHVKKVKEK